MHNTMHHCVIPSTAGTIMHHSVMIWHYHTLLCNTTHCYALPCTIVYGHALLCTTTALSLVKLDVPMADGNTTTRLAWREDGNVDYLHGKHIPFFIVALSFGLVTLPYAILFLVQWLFWECCPSTRRFISMEIYCQGSSCLGH